MITEYREWNKQERVMAHFSAVSDHEGLRNLGSRHDDWVMMMSTCNNDSTGKEIYEGDIVEWTEQSTSDTPPQDVRAIVVWAPGFAAFVLARDNKESGELFYQIGADAMRIVGNIHEG